jgi:hypothetical protein
VQAPRGQGDNVEVGSLWRRVALGSEAVYEVVADHGDHIDVVVRTAPLLRPGTPVRLTRAAVAGMELLGAEQAQRVPARPTPGTVPRSAPSGG